MPPPPPRAAAVAATARSFRAAVQLQVGSTPRGGADDRRDPYYAASSKPIVNRVTSLDGGCAELVEVKTRQITAFKDRFLSHTADCTGGESRPLILSPGRHISGMCVEEDLINVGLLSVAGIMQEIQRFIYFAEAVVDFLDRAGYKFI